MKTSFTVNCMVTLLCLCCFSGKSWSQMGGAEGGMSEERKSRLRKALQDQGFQPEYVEHVMNNIPKKGEKVDVEKYKEITSKFIQEYRQGETKRMKADLKLNDEEWGVIQPLIERVVNKQREYKNYSVQPVTAGLGGMSMGGMAYPVATPTAEVSQTKADLKGSGDSESIRHSTAQISELKKLVQAQNPESADIKAKLEELRKLRGKAGEELKKLQDELRSALTVKQEATLVLRGVLD